MFAARSDLFHRVFVTNSRYNIDRCSAHHYQRLAIADSLVKRSFSEGIETNFL